ncbi:MAG: hypothetical protein J7K46_12230 [Bacteroidales bacterium]|nr:hypothetical protein [Bacteroidales bacterium]
MKKFTFCFILFLFIFITSCRQGNKQIPRTSLKVGPQSDGSILLPTNQLLRPAGLQLTFTGRPVDMALSPDGKWIAVLNMSALNLIRVLDRTIMQTLPFRGGGSFQGISFSKDGTRLFVSQARDRILVAVMDKDHVLHWSDPVVFSPAGMGGNPVPGGFAFNDDETRMYVPLNRDNTLAVVDMEERKMVGKISVGVAPYEVILLSSQKAYVSNWGGRHPEAGESVYPSSGTKMLVDPKTGIANNGSLSVIDLVKGKAIKSIETGLHPGAMVLSPDKKRLFVACANSDLIMVIDTRSDIVTDSISVHLDKDLPFGSAPNALAVSPDGKRLYVANGTDNAVCVIQLDNQNRIAGFIPVAWYPGALLLDKNFLVVANIKGFGERNLRADRPGYNTHNPLGSLSFIPIPGQKTLKQMTKVVSNNNHYEAVLKQLTGKKKIRGKVPVPVFPGQKSVFEHVVYIIKENRTYDQVLGDMPGGNGDTMLVQFGREVSPNHHALAEEFGLLDNFYCSGVLSADGHQWTDEAYVTDYLEKSFGDFPRSYPYDGDDPLAYSPAGFIWDNVMNHGLTFRNYGEFVNADITPRNATFKEIYQDYMAGTHHIRIRAKVNLPQLQPYTCPVYIGFPNKVLDQYRADVFIKELKKYEEKNRFPNLVILLLPNDHTSGTRPGMPAPGAAVADNDLALGRIVEAISHSKFWKTTCVFVTEDDPQAGLDHVDSHRTIGFVISPYSKRGKVISDYYTQISMFRTIENILGIPPLNRFDRTAEPMTGCFTDKPDFSPYTAIPNNIPLDKINPSLKDLSGDALFWARKSMEQDLDDVDRIDEDTFNRILWHAMKGYDVPYPEI